MTNSSENFFLPSVVSIQRFVAHTNGGQQVKVLLRRSSVVYHTTTDFVFMHGGLCATQYIKRK